MKKMRSLYVRTHACYYVRVVGANSRIWRQIRYSVFFGGDVTQSTHLRKVFEKRYLLLLAPPAVEAIPEQQSKVERVKSKMSQQKRP